MTGRQRIRVLLLCERLDVAGGVERFVCALANHLAGEGMDVAVGSVDTPAPAVRYPLDPKVRVLAGVPRRAAKAVDDAGARVVRAARLLRAQWRTGRALTRVMRDEQPQVVLFNGLTTACSALVLDRRFAPRTICCDHNHFAARSALWRRLRRWLYPQVAAVVSLTEADAAKFRALNPHTRVIYNASSLHRDAPSLAQQPLALAVGRHVAQKGFDLLLRAWVAVAAALPHARLRVIGDGPLREQHAALARQLGIEGSVEWLAPTDRIEAHYREAALFVLSSRYEGMPLALLEAQAMGLPAVAFDCPTGPSEIVTPDTGMLVPAGDVEAMAKAIVALLQSSALREKMAYAAIERSREVFSPTEHFRRWTALVREIAGRQTDGTAA